MPRIFDNIEKPLLPALQETLKVAERADFCVGYFNLRGWRHLAQHVDSWSGGDGQCCRLLVGMHVTPTDELRRALRSHEEDALDNQTAMREKRHIAEEFRQQLTFGIPTNDDEAALRELAEQIRTKKLVVKVYLRHPLHAKLYLLHRQDANNPVTGFLGSSNLTLLKLILILDHMANNKLAPPPSKYIEGFRHDLIRLFDATKAVCTARGLTFLDEFPPDSLPIRILDFLDRFADTGGRYSNINKLTGHKHQAVDDPIVKWGEIASQIMQTQATPGERQRAQLNGQMARLAFGDAAASLISDLNQQPMDVAPLHVRASELDTAAKHAIYALVTLIAALREVLDSLCDSAWGACPPGNSGVADVPDMKDFLQFAWADRQYVMRKRRWP